MKKKISIGFIVFYLLAMNLFAQPTPRYRNFILLLSDSLGGYLANDTMWDVSLGGEQISNIKIDTTEDVSLSTELFFDFPNDSLVDNSLKEMYLLNRALIHAPYTPNKKGLYYVFSEEERMSYRNGFSLEIVNRYTKEKMIVDLSVFSKDTMTAGNVAMYRGTNICIDSLTFSKGKYELVIIELDRIKNPSGYSGLDLWHRARVFLLKQD